MRAVLTLLLLCLGLTACGEEEAGGSARLRVVATTGQAADFARAVGGERVQVTGLLAANADPHAFEIRPDDVKELGDAELVVRWAATLDEWLEGAIDSSGADAPVLVLADAVELADDDPTGGRTRATRSPPSRALRDALAKADPAGAEAYPARRTGIHRAARTARRSGRETASTKDPRLPAHAGDDTRRARLLRPPLRASASSAP